MRRRPRDWIPELLVALLWLLPVMVPYTAGLWWLYENHYLLSWLGAMLGVSALMMLFAHLVRRREHGVRVAGTDAHAAEAEQRAREALRRVVDEAGPADVESPAALEALVRRVLAAVAGVWNPKASHAELRFTLPEALTLAEHLTHRLRVAIREDLPSLQHVQVAHALQLNRGIKPALTLWRIYRAGRFILNPVGSLVLELHRGVLQSFTPLMVKSAKSKAAAVLARETGEAAILLYSGRFRREADRLESDSPVLNREPEAGPLTLLIAGQPNAGKSSLINALSGRARAVAGPLPREAGFPAYALEEETAGELALVDSPGLEGPPDNAWQREAARADLVVWVAAAHRADRAVDQRALQSLRERTGANFRERRSPILLVLTHVDRLDPAPEWSPPYDPYEGTRPKERAMRASRGAICASLDFPTEQAVPVMVRDPEEAWNLEDFWRAAYENLPAARQARLERLLTRRGRLEGVRDAVRTLPGVVKQLGSALRREGGSAPPPMGL